MLKNMCNDNGNSKTNSFKVLDGKWCGTGDLHTLLSLGDDCLSPASPDTELTWVRKIPSVAVDN